MPGTLSLTSRIRIGTDVVFHDLQGEMVLLNLKIGVYFGLDPVGTRIWQLCQEPSSVRSILDTLLDEYDVTEARCATDLLEFIRRLREHDLVEAVD